MHNQLFELKIDSIERFMGYDSSTYKSVYMVTKELPKIDEEKKRLAKKKLKLKNKKKRFKQFLFFIISRLFVNISFSQIRTTDQFEIIFIKQEPPKKFF